MFNWIILGFFLASITWHLIRALTKPMIKNVLTLACIPVALLITSLLHRWGLFVWAAEKIIVNLNLDAETGAIVEKLLPVASALLAPTLFVIVFRLVFWLLKILHVNLVTKYLKNKNIKREKKELKAAIKEERERLEETIRENEERNRQLLESLPEDQQEAIISKYEPIDEDEIEDMVDERIKEEKKRRKKQGYFRESSEHKLISIVCGLVCGFLLFAISLTPIFYFMDVVTEVTDCVIEGAEYREGDEKTKIYLAIETLDKYIVGPYHESPVISLYEDMGIVDLLTGTVQKGAKIAEDLNGNPVYVNEIVKLGLSRGVRLACAMLDMNYSDDFIRSDMEDLTVNNPIYQNMVDAIADYLVKRIEEDPGFLDSFANVSEDDQGIISMFLGQVFGIYKNGVVADDGTLLKTNKDVIKDDFNALTDVVIIFSENKLLAKILSDHAEDYNLFGDSEFLAAMLNAASKLTPYKPAMETVFTYAVGILGSMEALGLPENNAAGYDLLVSQLVDALNGINDISETGREEIQKLFIEVSEYKIKDGVWNFVNDRIAELEAQILEREAKIELNNIKIAEIDELLSAGGLTDDEIKAKNSEKDDLISDSISQQYVIEDLLIELNGREAEGVEGEEGYIAAEQGYLKILEEVTKEREEYSGSTNVLQYIADTLYVVEIIYKQEGGHIDNLIEKLGADADKAEEDRIRLENELNVYTNETSVEFATLGVRIKELEFERDNNPEGWTTEKETELNNAMARTQEIQNNLDDLNKQIKEFAQNAKNLLALKDVMVDTSKYLTEKSTEYLKEAETRLAEFTPFMEYYMNWTNIQKPLLLAGEDKTSACLSIRINGKLYVCNTDIITIDSLLDLAFGDNGLIGGGEGESGEGEGSEEDKIHDITVDEYLDKIPFRDLFESITIVEITEENKGDYENRVSPYTNLLNYLIAVVSDEKIEDSTFTVDNEMFFNILSRYVTILSESEKYFVDNSAEFISIILSVTEENKKEFNYKGATLEQLLATLNFDAWDIPGTTAKEEDTKKIVNIFLAFVDLIGDMVQTEGTEDAEGAEGDEAAPASEETGSAIAGIGDTTALLELLNQLGATLDLMAETECLGKLPAVMVKVILTNPMIGKVMTTSMLYGEKGYLAQVDKIASEYELSIEEREVMVDENGENVVDENGNLVYRYTYTNFMNDFVNTIDSLLEKAGSAAEGGNNNA